MSGLLQLGEALFVGLTSGPACVASCGPVLVPSLLAERDGLRVNARYLGAFLGTRLVGYLLFALIVGQLGTMAELPQNVRAIVFGIVHLLLALVLLWYARSVGRACPAECSSAELVTIGAQGNEAFPPLRCWGSSRG